MSVNDLIGLWQDGRDLTQYFAFCLRSYYRDVDVGTPREKEPPLRTGTAMYTDVKQSMGNVLCYDDWTGTQSVDGVNSVSRD